MAAAEDKRDKKPEADPEVAVIRKRIAAINAAIAAQGAVTTAHSSELRSLRNKLTLKGADQDAEA